MKKILKTFILFMLILGVVFTTVNTSVTTVQAASTRTKAMNAYRKFLKKGKFTASNGRTYNIYGFTVIDINKDRVPELIIESADTKSISVFTYKKGKVKILSDWIGQVWTQYKGKDYIEYNSSQKALVIRTHGGTGLSGYDLISYKKGKLYTKLSIDMSSYWMNGKVISRYSYSKQNGNSRNYSYKIYKKLRKQYFSGKKVRKYYFARNTAAKRNKLR